MPPRTKQRTGRDAKSIAVDDDIEDVTAAPTTERLDDIASGDCVEAWDFVDKLRSIGADSEIDLPQVVVCGEQSTGKSSVLEALTQIPFPSQEGLCTRFATEISIRRGDKDRIQTKIIPGAKVTGAQKKQFLEFNQAMKSFDDLPAVITAATELMNLRKKDSKKDPKQSSFSESILRVEIEGPDRRPFTFVDLPGWVNVAVNGQTEEELQRVRDHICEYIKQPRTIILMVVAASSNLSNYKSLGKVLEVDPNGERTIGVITKMDMTHGGGEEEQQWLSVARNESIELEQGWHMLRNRTPEEQTKSLSQRNATETKFFNSGAYKSLPPDMKGIDSLFERISTLMCKHFRNELPKLVDEAEEKYKETVLELKKLGEQRTTFDDQSKVLVNISLRYYNIVKNAVDGHADGDTLRVSLETQPKSRARGSAKDQAKTLPKPRTLRAAVSELQEDFTHALLKYGNKYRIVETEEAAGTHSPNIPEPTLLPRYEEQAKHLQVTKPRNDAVAWAKELHQEIRGRELPGNFNSPLVDRLFHEQSVNWRELARIHLDSLDSLCLQFIDLAVKKAVRSVASDDVAKKILVLLREPLAQRLINAHLELAKLLQDKEDPVTIYDPDFAANVKLLNDHAKDKELQAARDRANQLYPGQAPALLGGGPSQLIRKPAIALDNNTLAAEKALDQLIALYKVEVKTFAKNVTQQVVERNLLKNLAQETFSTELVQSMTEEEIAMIAGEDRRITKRRQNLERRKEILKEGMQEIDKLINPLKRRAPDLDENDELDIPFAKRQALGQ